MASSDGMLVMTHSGVLSMGSSHLRGCAISANPGGGHRGWDSDEGWYGMISHSGVGGAPAVAVAHLAVVAGQPSLWVTGIAPLGWAMLLWV